MNAEEVKRLLPWYAVDALDDEERRDVEHELARSADLRRELAEVQVLKETVRANGEELPQFRDSLLDDALARIDDLERAGSDGRPRASVTVLDRFRRNVTSDWRAASGVTRFALAAQFALIFVLAGFLLLPAGREDDIGETAAGSETVSAEGGAKFKVVFVSEVSIGDIGAFLDGQGLRIVSGPSAQQAYVVEAVADSRIPDDTLAHLKASPQVVIFAERMTP